ncbi:MAG: DUF433 domain-containing protein [Pseudomonadota bacterium]
MGYVVAAFSEDHAARLTGVSVGQLRYWDRDDFFSPSFVGDPTIGRVYSFRDIVSLKVLNVLRNQHGVSLQHLRRVGERLADLAEDKWTATKLWVSNKKVVWVEPSTEKLQEVVSGQYVVRTVELATVAQDMKRDIESLNVRSATQLGQVEKSRFVNHNDPVIAGTRVRVRAVKRFAQAGYTVRQILQEFPDLRQEDVHAAMEYEPRAAA